MRYAELRARGADVVGVSADNVDVLRQFKRFLGVEFSLVPDTERRLIDAYHVRSWLFGRAKRRTYVIDRDRTILRVIGGATAARPSVALRALGGGETAGEAAAP